MSGQPSQPLKGLQSLSSLREDHPRTSCLSQYAPSSAGMRDGPEDCVDYVFEGYAGPRLFPLHHDSWTRDFSRSSPGVPTATAGPDNTLQRLFLRGNSKPRLYEHIHRRVAKAPARSNAPAGTRGKCSSHGPALQTKSDPRSPPEARGRGDTRRGGARRGLPPGAGGGVGGAAGELIRAASRQKNRGVCLEQRRVSALGEARRQQQPPPPTPEPRTVRWLRAWTTPSTAWM